MHRIQFKFQKDADMEVLVGLCVAHFQIVKRLTAATGSVSSRPERSINKSSLTGGGSGAGRVTEMLRAMDAASVLDTTAAPTGATTSAERGEGDAGWDGKLTETMMAALLHDEEFQNEVSLEEGGDQL
jgi:hypothetical protein